MNTCTFTHLFQDLCRSLYRKSESTYFSYCERWRLAWLIVSECLWFLWCSHLKHCSCYFQILPSVFYGASSIKTWFKYFLVIRSPDSEREPEQLVKIAWVQRVKQLLYNLVNKLLKNVEKAKEELLILVTLMFVSRL